MLLATWNVNSVRSRLPHLESWLASRHPDVVALQETKVVDEDFPREPLERLGYQVETWGQKTYNGVALLSRLPLERIERGLPGETAEDGRRLIAADVAGTRVINVYVPNGSEVGSAKFAAKLAWLGRLEAYLGERHTPADKVVVCGDFNIAPEARDVHDPARWEGQVLFHPDERAALARLIAWGLVDLLRLLHPDEGGLYTWWDYRMGAFPRGWGLRIDHILATPPVSRACRRVIVDVEERRQERPSDHAPVIAELAAGEPG